MDWPQIITLVLSGGIVTKLVDVAVQGWREQATARGNREDERDRLRRSRLVWMEEASRVRRLAWQLGATEAQVGEPPEDPYTDRP